MNLQGGRWGEAIVAAAGPLSNLVLAIAAALPLRYLIGNETLAAQVPELVFQILFTFIVINVVLMIFNLFPIPPLDGSKMLHAILPYEAQKGYEQIEQYGFVLLFLLVFVGAVSYVYVPVVLFVARLLGIH
jgi:Zn-dependent protease